MTRYRLLQMRHGLSLLEIRLDTGRKHQIRVHLASIGCTVAGDRRYGTRTLDPCHRLGLHAGGLTLTHPLTGKPLAFESPLPKPLAKLFPPPGTGR
jgi:23S rRNA pseudouridine1911/1915/1917 synthase